MMRRAVARGHRLPRFDKRGSRHAPCAGEQAWGCARESAGGSTDPRGDAARLLLDDRQSRGSRHEPHTTALLWRNAAGGCFCANPRHFTCRPRLQLRQGVRSLRASRSHSRELLALALFAARSARVLHGSHAALAPSSSRCTCVDSRAEPRADLRGAWIRAATRLTCAGVQPSFWACSRWCPCNEGGCSGLTHAHRCR
jgi:hypothetical protein